MNLRELTWPVRIYWDLAETPAEPGSSLKICEEIVGAKILFLSLRETASELSPACRDILRALKGKNIGVSLTLPASALSPLLWDQREDLSLKSLLFNVSSFSGLRLLLERAAGEEAPGLPFGISFDVGRDNYGEIPEVVSFCLNNGIRDLVFPIQRFGAGSDIFYLNKGDRDRLSELVAGIDLSSLRITIHDPFLWQVFFPDTDYHEGGCQAGNSMLYISPAARVYPCPAMPIELGDLAETSLKEITLSDMKKKLRHSLLVPPGECAACDVAVKCLGGCRGRAFASVESLDRRDPACA